MRKLFSCLLVIPLCLALSSCSSDSGQHSIADNINISVEKIISADHISWSTSSYLEFSDEKERTVTSNDVENQWIKEPFGSWSKNRMVTKDSDLIFEVFQEEKEGLLVRFSRVIPQDVSANQDVPWDSITISEVNQVTFIKEAMESNIAAHVELLRMNAESFKMDSGEKDGSEGIMKYSGSISQDSVLKVYETFLRETYVKAGFLLDKKNPSKKDLLEEIKTDQNGLFQQGIPSLVFSDNPIPLSIWVNMKTNSIEKVIVDTREAMQNMFSLMGETAEVDVSTLSFEIVNIDALEKLSLPE